MRFQVNVVAPTKASVMLDNAPVSNFTPIGTTGYAIARIPLANSGDGNHTISANLPFGISVYGYGQYTSYWYPGGLDLTPLGL
ncbi:MAG: IgGFc-binding protein [Deltaproteobacteria bacterium]|nr:IgGFc-binding protein [Deltaproteobacteria bacterium]